MIATTTNVDVRVEGLLRQHEFVRRVRPSRQQRATDRGVVAPAGQVSASPTHRSIETNYLAYTLENPCRSTALHWLAHQA